MGAGKGWGIVHRIRPAVWADGGGLELVGVEDGVVLLMCEGAYAGRPSSMMTLEMGIGALVREEIPEVGEVVAL